MVAGRDDAKAVRSILQAGKAVAAGDQHDVIQWKSVCWRGYNSFAARASKQVAEQNSRRERRERRDLCSRGDAEARRRCDWRLRRPFYLRTLLVLRDYLLSPILRDRKST